MCPFIIAELGTAHGGSLTRAEEMIGRAAEAGADCVKFQVVIAREIIHPETGIVPLPGGDTPLYEVFKSLEKTGDFYEKLRLLCEKEEVEFLATPFGLESWSMLKEMNVKSVKVASPELNHFPLLKALSDWQDKQKIILSSGVSLLSDIERALSFFTDLENITLLHCVTFYPAPPEEYNLNILPLYRKLFGCATGVSDHSVETLPVPLTATALEASMIEKHFCLNHSDGGLDDPIALRAEDFATMVKEIREASLYSSEKQIERLNKRFGENYIKCIMGTGRKVLAPSEMKNYGRTNRSIHGMIDLKAGTILTRENISLLRTEKILAPGLAPQFYESLLGHRLTSDVKSGQGITWNDVLT